MKMSRFLVAAAVSGIIAGAGQTYFQTLHAADGDTPAAAPADADKHGCKGANSCAGKGGCKSDSNACKGQNSCKGKGGCATAVHDCKGQNACKGQGKGADNACAGKGGCKTSH
jgi:hypothetical protein